MKKAKGTVYNVHTAYGGDYWTIAASLEAALRKVVKSGILPFKDKPTGVTVAGTLDV